MTPAEIHDELATLRAAILQDCDLYPTKDFGLGAVPGSLYCSEEYLVSADAEQASQLMARYFVGTPGACILSIGDLTIFLNEDETVNAALICLEHNHD